jgi:CheY-like chemotaxis protein
VAIKTILLVDDETIHRDIGHSVLSPHYQVDFADNGVDAVQKCEIKQYDLILMDLHMPKMNGEQATMALRKQVSKETIIIGLTSLPLGANQSGLLAKGFTGFLEKPLTMKGLQNVLRAYSRYA